MKKIANDESKLVKSNDGLMNDDHIKQIISDGDIPSKDGEVITEVVTDEVDVVTETSSEFSQEMIYTGYKDSPLMEDEEKELSLPNADDIPTPIKKRIMSIGSHRICTARLSVKEPYQNIIGLPGDAVERFDIKFTVMRVDDETAHVLEAICSDIAVSLLKSAYFEYKVVDFSDVDD